MTVALPLRFSELTTEQAATSLIRRDAIALLPIGSTEAHGPHLPLETDVIIALAAADRAATAIRSENTSCFVLPPIAYAVTEFVSDFAGTLSVRASVVSELIQDVCRAALRSGFARVVLVNGHLEPEHGKMLKDAARALVATGFAVVFADQRRPPTVSELGAEFALGGGHAGGYETAIVMASRPDLVREEVRRALPPNPKDLGKELAGGATRAREIGGDRAYFGYPADATRDEGERILSVLSRAIAHAARAEISR